MHRLQVQFNSQRLDNDMFQVKNGEVKSVTINTSKLLTRSINEEEDSVDFGVTDRQTEPLNPNGYM